jgi:hypothetical protein
VTVTDVLGVIKALIALIKKWLGIQRDTEQAETDRNAVDNDVASRPDDQLDRDLDKWMRD